MSNELGKSGGLVTPPLGSRVLLAQSMAEPDHFFGLDEALHRRGLACDRLLADQTPVCVNESTRVVVIKDQTSFVSRYAVEQAEAVGATIVLLMDGIVEYRNTFCNPKVGRDFLRPAPADVVACAGPMDERTLTALGNYAVATGLPRLKGMLDLESAAGERAIMVATANTPAFNAGERERVLAALGHVRDTAARMGIRVHWRLTGGLENDLGVVCDRRALGQVMRDVRAVLTTPSTLLVEAMLAGRMTVLMDLHPEPCWQVGGWTWRNGQKRAIGEDTAWAHLSGLHEHLRGLTEEHGNLERTLERALCPTDADMRRQEAILAEMQPSAGSAAERLADLCLDLAATPRRTSHAKTIHTHARTPRRLGRGSKPRVVNMVFCDGSPVGGVQTWAMRLAREFASRDLGYDVRTLLITPQPETVPAWADDDLHQVCVFDPFSDHTEILRAVRGACEALEPAIVLPNFTDFCYMVAHQLRASGARTVAIAHTDHAYYKELISTYSQYHAAIGVSDACIDWLKPMTGDRPLHKIVYGVPVADAPREVSNDRAIRLMYCGRMVQEQKRIFDLLELIDGLEEERVAYELHMVGDGAELGEWRRQLSARTLVSGRVEVHGRCEPEWVQKFLKTIDLSVLVSDYEGTSVAMLEAMGAGVVPCVTRVNSGVDEWVRDGESGIVVPLRSPRVMAQRIAEIARNRSTLASMGRAAWQTAKDQVSIAAMADRYRRVFDEAMAAPAMTTKSDLGLHPTQLWFWRKDWVKNESESEAWIRRTLEEGGYRTIALDRSTPTCDAVLVRTSRIGVDAADVEAWRARGLGVAFSPHLVREVVPDVLRRALNAMAAEGCKRIAVYGTGKHTRRAAPVFYQDLPIVGFIDDQPPEWGHLFGLPVVTMDRANKMLKPDSVLISSDAWEKQMWMRSRPLREAGVRVVTMYGTYAEEATPLLAR